MVKIAMSPIMLKVLHNSSAQLRLLQHKMIIILIMDTNKLMAKMDTGYFCILNLQINCNEVE